MDTDNEITRAGISIRNEDGSLDRELLRSIIYKKYPIEDLKQQLITFHEENVDPYVLNDAGKSTAKISIHFFREEQYRAKNARSMHSPDDLLSSDELLQKAYEKIDKKPNYYKPEYGDDRNFINFITNDANFCSKVAIFSPNLARKIYERWCPVPHANIHDASCVDDETEYFNGYEWKSIKDYVHTDQVLQYNFDGTASLVYPMDYIHFESDEPFYSYDSYNTHQCLTGDHTIVYRNRVNETSELERNVRFIKVKDILGADFRGRIPTCFIKYGKVHVNENILRLAIAVQADGSRMYKSVKEPFRWKARFSKKHKIERFKEILEQCGIKYTLFEDTSNSHRGTGYNDRWEFHFSSEELCNIFDEHKEFPKIWYDLDKESKEVFLDEIFFWDGSHGDTYISTNKNNAELVYYLINSSGYSAKIKCDVRSKKNVKPCYYVSKKFYKATGFDKNWEIVDKKDKYCFTVSSHMLVLRRRGQTFITGNCGWGNRCLAAISSKYGYNYFGTDPNTALHEKYKQQADFVRETLQINPTVDIRCQGSEVFIPEWEGKMDLSFTSPPYFATEKYSDDDMQSAKQFGNYESWRDDFMRPTIKNVYKYLKPGAYYLLNLKNLTSSFGNFPAFNDWCVVAQEEGFILEDIVPMFYQSTRQFGTSSKTGKKREVKFNGDKEPVAVLRKPTKDDNMEEYKIKYVRPNTIDGSWFSSNSRKKSVKVKNKSY